MKMKRRKDCKKYVFALLVILALNALTYANPIYDFHIFNNAVYENDSRLNFTMTVSDEGIVGSKQKIGFTFSNNSTISSSITDIYFDTHPDICSSLVFSNVSIVESAGVSFSKNACPATLPGGNRLMPTFDKYPEYSVDSDSPISFNGINPNEWLKLVFTLKSDKTIDDVADELAGNGGCKNKNLRVGIFIQSLPQNSYLHCCPTPDCGSNSASAINCTQPTPVPEPATITLLCAGVLTLLKRKSSK
jgi:hypothetical protein